MEHLIKNPLMFGIAVLTLMSLIMESQALSCAGPCNPKKCPTVQCKGGKVRGVCTCCMVCAKTHGEKCGGLWNLKGKCDEGLVCIKQSPGPNADGKCGEFHPNIIPPYILTIPPPPATKKLT